ncbi:metallopeptidase family M24 [Phlyctema vagabunda]|uniref:Xaa-Pro aminopeptidase n=1 Tax=Phlyctema vagabunda TaxID=108571 RepID=A0ABR4P7S8_9HELO
MAAQANMEAQGERQICDDLVFVEEFDALSIKYRPTVVEKYPAKLHARSVARRLGVRDGLIYLPGLAERNYEDSDQPPPFRQRRYFYYLSGVNAPGYVVTYDIHTDKLSLWIPPQRDARSAIFNGLVPSVEEVKAKYDVDYVERVTKLDDYLTFYAHHNLGYIYVLHDYQAPRGIKSDVTYKDGSSSRLDSSPFDSKKLINAMDSSRAIKSQFELKLIRKACAITAVAHTNVLRGISRFSNEAEIEAVFTATCIASNAKHQSYGIIAAAGPNASTLHYIENNTPLKGQQLVCLDAGSEWKCYASDVTRTFPISGSYTPEAKDIYDLVAMMQEECIAMVVPGANFRSIHLHAHKVALAGLIQLGLLHKGTAAEIYASGATTAFFPHGLGHFLGLECHDVGQESSASALYGFRDLPESWTSAFGEMLRTSLRSTSVYSLEPNMVITVEPGIYFNRYALEEVHLKNDKYGKYINKDLLAKYYPVGGVRIEDDILVTEKGNENLTTAPKGDEALKIINESREKREVKKEAPVEKKKGWIW